MKGEGGIQQWQNRGVKNCMGGKEIEICWLESQKCWGRIRIQHLYLNIWQASQSMQQPSQFNSFSDVSSGGWGWRQKELWSPIFVTSCVAPNCGRRSGPYCRMMPMYSVSGINYNSVTLNVLLDDKSKNKRKTPPTMDAFEDSNFIRPREGQ